MSAWIHFEEILLIQNQNFCNQNLPQRNLICLWFRRRFYIFDNFLCMFVYRYVISTLELLVAEDYMIVYFHGATPRRQMPSFGWLKRCYQMIDRRWVELWCLNDTILCEKCTKGVLFLLVFYYTFVL